MRIKPFVSWMLMVTFLLLAASGVVLYLAPVGRIAHWSGWQVLGLSKEAWQAVHTNLAVLFAAAAVWHLVLNWSMLIGYVQCWGLKGLLPGPVGVAVALVAVFVAGTLWQWLPWGLLQQGNARMKLFWEDRLPRPPAPHAEEWTLDYIAERLAVPTEQLIQALETQGVVQPTAHQTLAQIASAAGQAPYQVFEAIRRRFPQADQALQPAMGKARKPGKKAQPTPPDEASAPFPPAGYSPPISQKD